MGKFEVSIKKAYFFAFNTRLSGCAASSFAGNSFSYPVFTVLEMKVDVRATLDVTEICVVVGIDQRNGGRADRGTRAVLPSAWSLSNDVYRLV
jgi:hypothetical protein